MPMWELEQAAADRGYSRICGCDEAGAGPLAGAVYAAAVILPLTVRILGQITGHKVEFLICHIAVLTA